jgi:hypothetical protein
MKEASELSLSEALGLTTTLKIASERNLHLDHGGLLLGEFKARGRAPEQT